MGAAVDDAVAKGGRVVAAVSVAVCVRRLAGAEQQGRNGR